ncbi:hybrid sensor histidine kinase/response regulator [Pseudidiomarina aestuarii]|uniref:Sensory/regulatory protein RpfC n=3 Tax=Pseudidiomarina aestuarii TaxID=624146 RepID=A0A2T4CZ11_9GAMM|nr:hybrid sensor histidine kinase/response regulator [Pseudidiomarina aestuarii]PTB89313.1 hybrid sensor histidine kinase/response regulator [Pseudidiomarina aestuarii]
MKNTPDQLKQMQEAVRDAQAAAEAKSEFLANVSHEIRTPINAILGMTQLCLKTGLDEQQRGYLKSIESSSKILLGIINDILDFSKIEANKLTIETIPFDLEEMLASLADMFAYRAYDKNLEFVIKLPSNIPTRLIGDPLRLNQVLVNLVSNAIKFTDSGEIVISVTLLDLDDHEVFLRFSVTDTGIGMDEHQRAKLFQAFTQADSSTTRKFGGTGLGLAISQRIVKLMNDDGIGVISSSGQGSTFFLELKLPLQPNADQTVAESIRARLAQKSILAIDDNLTTRDMITELLRSHQVQVTSVRTAEDALDVMQTQRFDACFVDWQLPGMSGLDFCRELLATESATKPTPALILATSYHAHELRSEARAAGVQHLIVKPYLSSSVIRVLSSALALFGDSAEQPGLDLEQELCCAPILIVEDNDINLHIAQELLTHAGVQVDTAMNGAEAIEQVKRKQYALVFMDIQMPVMDGLTAAEHIRTLYSYQQLPIIAMTANTSTEDVERSLAAGMQDHISKPIDEKVLLKALQKWCVRGEYAMPMPVAQRQESTSTPAISYPRHADIDFQSALERLQHNTSLYRTLIERLVHDYSDAPQKIVDYLAKGQHDEARRFFHTLKGAAGNLGLMRLEKAAAELERHTKSGDYEYVADHIMKLNQLLEQAGLACSDLLLWQQRNNKKG